MDFTHRFTSLPRSLVVATILVAAGCSNNRTAPLLTPPEILIRQLGGTASAARYERGPLPVNFRVEVRNRSKEVLTLKRISVESMGEGAYTLRSHSQGFDKDILPDRRVSVEFWAPAFSESTILGANGPVTIRGIAYFSSPAGVFQRVFIQQVNDPMRR